MHACVGRRKLIRDVRSWYTQLWGNKRGARPSRSRDLSSGRNALGSARGTSSRALRWGRSDGRSCTTFVKAGWRRWINVPLADKINSADHQQAQTSSVEQPAWGESPRDVRDPWVNLAVLKMSRDNRYSNAHNYLLSESTVRSDPAFGHTSFWTGAAACSDHTLSEEGFTHKDGRVGDDGSEFYKPNLLIPKGCTFVSSQPLSFSLCF